jgi:hypothetical protein
VHCGAGEVVRSNAYEGPPGSLDMKLVKRRFPVPNNSRPAGATQAVVQRPVVEVQPFARPKSPSRPRTPFQGSLDSCSHF